MNRAVTLLIAICAAALFGWQVPLARIFDIVSSATTALSILIAAVLVRLNRGMPALEWKSLEPEKRKTLTTAIADLSREYGLIIGLYAAALAALMALALVGKADVQALWPSALQRVISGAIGAISILCVSRMGYVVWRDIDIVRLQKTLIDELASREEEEQQHRLAVDKISNIRTANLRRTEAPKPKAWGE